MTSSYRALKAAVERGTQCVFYTSVEVETIVNAAEDIITHHYKRLASPWDLPKLLCGVLRVQLNARMTQSEHACALPLSCLLRLLVVSWQLCPLISLPPPASTAPGSVLSSLSSSTQSSTLSTSSTDAAGVLTAANVFRISRKDMERVAVELNELSNINDTNACVASAGSPTSIFKNNPLDGFRTALSVTMALLSYWHALAAEDEPTSTAAEDFSDDSDFRRVSESVWLCVYHWTAPNAAAGARSMALATWLCTVLRRALRTDASAPSICTVHWLEGFLSASLCVFTPPAGDHGVFASAALDACWARLHTRVCHHVCSRLHQSQAALKARWSSAVAPVLARAFAHEPPLLSGGSLQPFVFGDSLEDTLETLTAEVRRLHQHHRHGAPSEDFTLRGGAATVAPLLQLAALQRHVETMRLRTAPFVTAQTYAACLRPVVAVCLRWGLVDAAQALCAWAGDALDDHGRAWQRRLRKHSSLCDAALAEEEAMPLPAAGRVRKDNVESDSGRSCLYPTLLQHLLSTDCDERLSAPRALDALVWCDNEHHRRLVCDALLRCPAPWSTQVLTDPFAAFFVLQSLSKVAAHCMDVGDPPLARFYIALLAQLLPRYLCPSLLRELMQLLHRLADTLSAYRLSPFNYSLPSAAYGESVRTWRLMKTFFDGAASAADGRGGGATSHNGWNVLTKHMTGAAWKNRRAFQRYCAGDLSTLPRPCGGTPNSADVRCTVVEVHYVADSGEALRLHCHPIDSGASTPHQTGGGETSRWPSCTVTCTAAGESLRACAEAMTDILRCNREQLLRGTGGPEAVGEKALCADSDGSRGGTSVNATASTAALQHEDATAGHDQPSTWPAMVDTAESSLTAEAATQTHHHQQQERKRQWWRARFELDDRISQVVASLQSTLGAFRVLLAGRPSEALTSQLSTLAMQFTTRCVQRRDGLPCPSVDALHQATLQVLLGGPFLWSASRSGTDAQPTCFYCPPEVVPCPACATTLHNARRTMLRAIFDLGEAIALPSAEAQTHQAHSSVVELNDASEGEDGWVSLLVDHSVAALVDELTSAALDAYYCECARHTAAAASEAASPSFHSHLDLLLHPREHTYLVLAGELNGLPWEGLDVCRDRSTSRVPSLDYVRNVSSLLRGTAVSLRRTLLYRDGEALQSPSGLTELLQKHPAWEVHYGETRTAAAAAQTHGRASSSSLLRRVAGAPQDADHIDTYVYAGHRGGEQLIARSALYEWLPPLPSVQPSLVLLMGCSSARMPGNAHYDAFGLPHAYLSAGVACCVGCLWDVTDGDVDRLTCRLLRGAAAAMPNGPTTIGEALAVARRACRLRCLTGLSTVFYGANLPIESCATSTCNVAAADVS